MCACLTNLPFQHVVADVVDVQYFCVVGRRDRTVDVELVNDELLNIGKLAMAIR